MKRLSLYIAAVALTALTACEDKVDLNIKEGKSYPVMDAWITTDPGQQHIKFTMSVPYTDNNPAPIINDATITLFDLTAGKTYPFAFKDKMYTYDAGTASIGVVGHAYKLHVEYKGEIFEAYDTIRRVATIDSITSKFKKKEDARSGKEGYYATFHARDPLGGPDYNWIRSYRNDTLTRLKDMLTIDGSLAEGVSDGQQFILPVEEGITREDKPFQQNEKVIVRLFSATYRSYDFLLQLNNQLESGGLFAKVLENVKSNMDNTTPNGKIKMLGWFGASAVSRAEYTFK
ncbi:MAG TPA: DUF4249 domain-containing protein [Chitinophaga sp.]|uniref:DUF4249 domain-containing protein n=1 Tax=Chitinophaga sp. TaxID=1869181 RepID=UPI002BF19BA7|nr:DUF4249 domain-containing protein [Chitinophaga sp.]HVI47345.1 DUF4249 domain-containing protein [Chitinophaga sp.]